MDDERDQYPVYVGGPSDAAEGEKPIGTAHDKKSAAKLIREKTGDPDFRASDVYWSHHRQAYFGDES